MENDQPTPAAELARAGEMAAEVHTIIERSIGYLPDEPGFTDEEADDIADATNPYDGIQTRPVILNATVDQRARWEAIWSAAEEDGYENNVGTLLSLLEVVILGADPVAA